MKKLKGFLLTLISILFSFSCEIGLGASVDTEAPSLEISNPPSDAIIRDEFAITGSWGDDGSISAVYVQMNNIENGTKKEFSGTSEKTKSEKDNNKGTWKIYINPMENGLIDGTYEAIIAIKDNGGHTTTMARTFVIDNTPPVLVLSRPSTKDGSKGFDNYGRTFSLEGKAADDNEVNLIEVNIFENADSTL